MSTTRNRGQKDQAARAVLAPLVATGTAVCPRCNERIDPDEAWDAGHVDDLALGGDANGPRRPEHTSCNRSAGARLRWRLPTERRRAARLAEYRDRFF